MTQTMTRFYVGLLAVLMVGILVGCETVRKVCDLVPPIDPPSVPDTHP